MALPDHFDPHNMPRVARSCLPIPQRRGRCHRTVAPRDRQQAAGQEGGEDQDRHGNPAPVLSLCPLRIPRRGTGLPRARPDQRPGFSRPARRLRRAAAAALRDPHASLGHPDAGAGHHPVTGRRRGAADLVDSRHGRGRRHHLRHAEGDRRLGRGELHPTPLPLLRDRDEVRGPHDEYMALKGKPRAREEGGIPEDSSASHASTSAGAQPT